MTDPAATGDPRTVLTVNAGSTSVKLRVLGPGDEVLARRDLGPLLGHGAPLAASLTDLDRLFPIGAVAHRVVHGGPNHTRPAVVGDELIAELAELENLAPSHAGPALAAMRVALATFAVPQVACFDTAFHAELPAEASTYAIPLRWRQRYTLRRYGFHGLSHGYAARRTAALLGADPTELRLVTCHLGAGASLAAIRGGRSVDTTMGFTPLEGLVMSTRSGDVDPGLLLWLARTANLGLDELVRSLENESGLLALAGRPDTLGALFARADAGDDRCQLAVDVYLHRLAAGIAAMTASLGGLDALVFTGGVGEHEPRLRHAVAERLDYLGVAVDPVCNSVVRGVDTVISPDGSVAAVLVVHAREDLELARGLRGCLRDLAFGGLTVPG
jgi:acetate kinase